MDKKTTFSYVTIIGILTAIIISIVVLNTPYKTQKIQKTIYQEKVDFEGIYFVNEKVLHKGNFENKLLNVKNGEIVPKGKVIYKDYTSDIQGKVLLYIDGYENKFFEKSIKNVEKSDLEKIKNTDLVKGIKIVDNSIWNLLIVVNKDRLKSIKKGSQLEIEVNQKIYIAEVKDFVIKGENIFIILVTKYDFPEFDLQRYFKGYIINSKYEGFILPRECMVELNGTKGVFVKIGEYVYFKPIKFSHIDYNIVVTQDEVLKNNDEVIINPKGLKDKQRIKR